MISLKKHREWYIIKKDIIAFLIFQTVTKTSKRREKMRFSVGYQQDERARWADTILNP